MSRVSMGSLRSLPLLALAGLVVTACSDVTESPTAPLQTAPTIQLSHVDPVVDASTEGDLCGGLSPCDAYDYGHPEGTGTPGFCFLSPMVDNHTSNSACSGDFVAGLDGVFQLTWCRVEYTDPDDGTMAPHIAEKRDDPDHHADCASAPQPLEEGGGFYSTSVRWRRSEAMVGDVFRLYVVRNGQHYAHRDVVIDPNDTRPADDFLHAIGYGTEPVKLLISADFACVESQTEEQGVDISQTCLIDGGDMVSFENDDEEAVVQFVFQKGNPTFVADFSLSGCLSLSDAAGHPLADIPLADCKISLSSAELQNLTVPGVIEINITDERWNSGPFADARLNVLQVDGEGVAVLPPHETPSPNWFGMATSDIGLLRWIGRGLDRLASLFGPQPAYAALRSGASGDFNRMSDFEVGLPDLIAPETLGSACEIPADYCTDLGAFGSGHTAPVSVKAWAPENDAPHTFDIDDAVHDGYFAVPDTRLHFFATNSSVACPGATVADLLFLERGCYDTGLPDGWGDVVVVTGETGVGTVDWTHSSGEDELKVLACGAARPGDSEADEAVNGVFGDLVEGGCSDRNPEASGYDNGPADGFTPFEPVDTDNEVAIYGLPLVFQASGCGDVGITVDGEKEPAWDSCAEAVSFKAPLQGSNKGGDNAVLYAFDDGDALYLGLEVKTDDRGNKIFIDIVENGADLEAAGDELLVQDFGDSSVPYDWHLTQACVDNNSASLCGEPDATEYDGEGRAVEAEAHEDGAGPGYVFYEFKRPHDSLNDGAHPPENPAPKEDLQMPGDKTVGIRVTVTQGQGGGKGSFTFPDPQTSPVDYRVFTLP